MRFTFGQVCRVRSSGPKDWSDGAVAPRGRTTEHWRHESFWKLEWAEPWSPPPMPRFKMEWWHRGCKLVANVTCLVARLMMRRSAVLCVEHVLAASWVTVVVVVVVSGNGFRELLVGTSSSGLRRRCVFVIAVLPPCVRCCWVSSRTALLELSAENTRRSLVQRRKLQFNRR